ncbi:MAG TPA: TadE/TadG family type IV pilus assembly protein [Oligoflexia bacterium]|nr:TadE/TadG family type IV pilus assembly protein [Oligoflexia bacterium]HMP27182.1 TadE/TadG family type IV pilus assembly protein [Oligoflexia bacterium]
MRHSFRYYSLLQSCGASAIEFAILLPALFLLILFFIWYGVTTTERVNLITSLATGVRLGATRGVPEYFGKRVVAGDPEDPLIEVGALDFVDEWRRGGSASRVFSLIVSPHFPSPAAQVAAFYDQAVATVYEGTFSRLEELPASHIYALIYTLEGMRLSSGAEGLKYPCDPDDPQGGGSGCLFCFPVNPITFKLERFYAEQASGVPSEVAVHRRVALGCRYQLSDFLLRPLRAMIRLLAGAEAGHKTLTISTYNFYDLPY